MDTINFLLSFHLNILPRYLTLSYFANGSEFEWKIEQFLTDVHSRKLSVQFETFIRFFLCTWENVVGTLKMTINTDLQMRTRLNFEVIIELLLKYFTAVLHNIQNIKHEYCL